MRAGLLALIVAGLTASTVLAQAPPACPWASCATGTDTPHTITITTNLGTQETNSYVVYRPANLPKDAAHPAPLMLVLPGGGETATQVEPTSRMSRVGDLAGWVVVYPWGQGGVWQKPLTQWPPSTMAKSDVPYLLQLLDYLQGAEAIDPARVYVSGHSAGAQMVVELMCDPASAGRFSGFGLVSANVQTAVGSGTPNCPAAPTSAPVLAYHGQADASVPYTGVTLSTKQLLSAPQMLEFLRTRYGCAAPTRTTFGNTNALLRDSATGCAGSGQRVELVTVPTGQHAWYGLNDRDGLLTSWDLYQRLTLSPPPPTATPTITPTPTVTASPTSTPPPTATPTSMPLCEVHVRLAGVEDWRPYGGC